MIKQYIQQVFYSIRQQKLLSGITIAATALTICLVMVILLLQQINVVPFAPESNRRKMLFVSQLNSKQNGSDVIAPMDQRVAEALFQTLQKPARVTLYEQQKSMPVKSLLDEGELSQTVLKVDDNFFHVFDLKFLSGGKFDKAQFESGAHVAIIAKQLSMFLFDTIESEGMQFEISDELYRVVGVVSDVSPLAYNAYAHVWIPYTSIASETSMFKHHGRFCATLLLNNLSDVNDVQKEVADALAGYNKQISPDTLLLRGQPEGIDIAYERQSNVRISEKDLWQIKRKRFGILFLIMLIPAIGLSAIQQSRFNKKKQDIAIARSFGCKQRAVVFQLLSESFVLTLMSGLFGLMVSFVIVLAWGRELILANNVLFASSAVLIRPSMLFQLSTFGWALLFCILFNLMIATIASWKISRYSITELLNGKV